jgi:hypothetical protein
MHFLFHENRLGVLVAAKYYAEHVFSTPIHYWEAITCTKKFRNFTSDFTLPSNTPLIFSDMKNMFY